MSKLKQILRELDVLEDEKEDNIINNLLKVPPKDKGINMPKTQNPTRDGIHQVDILFLPDDNGYKYALVAVDLATFHMDAEPLKHKDSETAKKALLKMYKRKYLNLPKRIEVDDGTEFKDAFKRYFDRIIKVRTKKPGRHRQQSVVESMNHILGKILNRIMLTEEIHTDQVSTEWVSDLPRVVSSINKEIDAMKEKAL